MSEDIEAILAEGRPNSLGRVNEVIELVLNDRTELDALYTAMYNSNAWTRMRAADAFEKVCRVRPEWIESYIDRIQADLSKSSQASIQWHIAQIYKQVTLSPNQQIRAIEWLKNTISTVQVDWIVAANVMDTLAVFTRAGYCGKLDITPLLAVQAGHKSNAVIKRATKLLDEFS